MDLMWTVMLAMYFLLNGLIAGYEYGDRSKWISVIKGDRQKMYIYIVALSVFGMPILLLQLIYALIYEPVRIWCRNVGISDLIFVYFSPESKIPPEDMNGVMGKLNYEAEAKSYRPTFSSRIKLHCVRVLNKRWNYKPELRKPESEIVSGPRSMKK